MKQSLFICIAAIALLTGSSYAQNYHVRIGTIGNSITEGTGLPNPSTQSYPAQLQVLLNEIFGDTCIVKNFGLTSTTMLRQGDVPYWNAPNFRDVYAYAPEICLISLGTNDSKPQNWDVSGDQFHADYLAMIDTLLGRNPSMKIMVCLPPPAFQVAWGIRDEVIVNFIIPTIDSVADERGAEIIDFHTAFLDSVVYFADGIHPNAEGARSMAQYIVDRIIETDIIHEADTGNTFVTSIKTGTANLVQGDSATLSWTTINADSVALNGQIVITNGSIKVAPDTTTVYTIKAMGEGNNDSLQLTQMVYTPELTRLSINPAAITIDSGDTIRFTLRFYDQMGAQFSNPTFDVEWTVEGSGYLIDETDLDAYFVAESADTVSLTVSYNDISGFASIKVRPVVGINENEVGNTVSDIYPNPGDNILNIGFEVDNPSLVEISMYDLKGGMIYNSTVSVANAGTHVHSFSTKNIAEGSYIVQLGIDGRQISSMVLIDRK